jgi:hypothetical protein
MGTVQPCNTPTTYEDVHVWLGDETKTIPVGALPSLLDGSKYFEFSTGEKLLSNVYTLGAF